MVSILQGLACAIGLFGTQVWAAPTAWPEPNIQPVVSPSWLLENLSNPDILVVDIRDSASYSSSHVPGSLSIPFAYSSVWSRAVEGDTLIMPPEDELFSDLGANGITAEKSIVIVTTTAQLPTSMVRATRVAATLRYAGHALAKVGILDGGFEAWNRIGGPTDDTPFTPTPTTYAGSVNGSFIVERLYVKENLNKLEEGILLLDARPSSAYTEGHIESALSIPLTNILEADGTFRPTEELLALFESTVGDAPVSAMDGEVIVYCWIGLMATGWHYTLNNILGFQNVKLYDGSVEDWVKEYPLVTG